MCNKEVYQKEWQHRYGAGFGHPRRHHRRRAWKQRFQSGLHRPPTNVQELDDKYELYLFAPGYDKKDFIISVEDQILRISVDRTEESTDRWKRREYVAKNFIRRFELDEKIDKAAISAKYEDGVLILSLPKAEGFETSRQEIEIA